MFISTKGRYALRLMLDLAESGSQGTTVPLKKVAENQNISLKYLEQIIPTLSRAGFVKSVRGSQGGYFVSPKAPSLPFPALKTRKINVPAAATVRHCSCGKSFTPL